MGFRTDEIDLFSPTARESIRKQLAEQKKTSAPRISVLSADPVKNLTEDQIQTLIMNTLTIAGYDVISTVHRYKRVRCSQCGFLNRPAGGYGATKGIGDLLVTSDKWTENYYIMADVKREKGALTMEQKERFARGKLMIWRSPEQALLACEYVTHQFKTNRR
jgi:hypothetical protein